MCVPCNHLRKKCPPNCVFEGLFPYSDQGKKDCKSILDTYRMDFLISNLMRRNARGKHEFISDLLFKCACRKIDPVRGMMGVLQDLDRQFAQACTHQDAAENEDGDEE